MLSTPSMQQLLEAGVHFGHQVRRGHPKMAPYIYGARDGVHIINLEYSEKLLKEAAEAVYKLGLESKTLLFVGNKKQAQPLVEQAAKKNNAFYLTAKWVGGLLTNFDEIRKNTVKLNDLKSQQDKGELDRYTKKEQLLISRRLQKFTQELGGIKDLEHLPDAVFLTDMVAEKTAAVEAKRIGCQVIAIVDTNANPTLVDYPIPGNDDAAKSLKLLIDTIANSYGEGLKKGNREQGTGSSKTKKEDAGEKSIETPIAEEVAAAEEQVEKEEVKEAERVV